MVKRIVVHPYRGILLSNKEKQTIGAHDDLDESPEIYVEEGKKSNP